MYEPTETDRGSLTHAFAVAEQITGTCAVLPNDVKLHWDLASRRYELDFYFHRAPARVAMFASAVGAVVESHPHGEGRTFTQADGVVDGVKVRAWSLNDTAVIEGLLAEQHHQIDDPSEPPLPAGLMPQQVATVRVNLPVQAAPAPVPVQS